MIVVNDLVVSIELEEILLSERYEVCGIAGTGEEAILMAKRVHPDLILMGLKLRGKMDGIEAICQIRSFLNRPFVIVTGHTEEEFLNRACLCKAAGYVVKPFHSGQVKAAVEMALRAHALDGSLPSMEIDKNYKNYANDTNLNACTENQSSFATLSQMEIKIASFILKGKRSKEIAEILNLSRNTVEWHRSNIRKKLGLKRSQSIHNVFPIS